MLLRLRPRPHVARSLARSLGRRTRTAGRTRQRQIELISQWFCCVIAVVDVEDAPLSWPPERARRQPPSPPRIAVDATPVRLHGRSSSFSPSPSGGRAWRKPAVDFGQCSSRGGPYRPIDRWETAMNSASGAERERRGGDGTGSGGSHDSLFPRKVPSWYLPSRIWAIKTQRAESDLLTVKAILRLPGLLLLSNGHTNSHTHCGRRKETAAPSVGCPYKAASGGATASPPVGSLSVG